MTDTETRVAEAARALGSAVADVERLRAERDDAIRAALLDGVRYRELERLTGLSRPMLDKIRRGK